MLILLKFLRGLSIELQMVGVHDCANVQLSFALGNLWHLDFSFHLLFKSAISVARIQLQFPPGRSSTGWNRKNTKTKKRETDETEWVTIWKLFRQLSEIAWSACTRTGLRPEDRIHFPGTSPYTSLSADDTHQAYLRVFECLKESYSFSHKLKSISESDCGSGVSCLA